MVVTIAAFLAVAFSCGLALAQGVSTIAGDLAEKRMSFYFSKPISPAALWSGKAIAAMLICLAALAIITLPSLLFAPAQFMNTWKVGGLRIALGAAIGCIVLFLISHALSTMMRSRSLLVVVDFLLALVTIGAAVLIARPIYVGGGARVAIGMLEGIALAVLVILAIAPVWQLANGRTDVKRSHSALSKVLWPAVAIALVLASGYAMWLMAVKPADLVETTDISQSPDGDHVFLIGRAAHRFDLHSSFVVDTSSGEYARLESPPWSSVTWSSDGRVVAWTQPVSSFPLARELELFTRASASNRSVATGIRVKGYPASVALSDDGSRVAIAVSGVVAVHDLRGQRILASAKAGGRGETRVFFVTPDIVRIANTNNTKTGADSTLTISELDIPHRALTVTGRREIIYGSAWPSFSKDGSRMFIPRIGEIADGRTGITIANVATEHFGSAMLSDGSTVAITKQQGAIRVQILNRDGAVQHEIELRGMKRAYVSAETKDGKIVLAASSLLQGRFDTTIVVDRARGVVERSVPGVHPWYDPSRRAPLASGKPLMVGDEKDRPMLLDLRSGETKKL